MSRRFPAASIAVIALALVTAACSSGPTANDEPSATATESVARNALSGRPGINGPVLVVKVDDTAPAHPQIGLEKADVIYVEQVEAGLTRLAAVFSSELPPRIGPVRSARISDIDIFANYGRVAFAYSGAQSKMLPIIAAAPWIDLGAQRQSSTIYTRDAIRRAPVNMILLPDLLLAKAAERNLVPDAAKSVGWQFGSLQRGGTQISSVDVTWPSSHYRITWNGSAFSLAQDGRAEVAETGTAYSPSTVVIQLARIAPSQFGDRYGGITPLTEVVGSGEAIVLRDGVAFRVRWSRPSAAAQTSFTTASGEPMAFAPGQVWVLLADRDRPPVIATRGPSPIKPDGATAGSNP